MPLLAPEAFEQRRELDRLAASLKAALAPHAGGVVRAIEIGRGSDKVLVLDDGDRYSVFQLSPVPRRRALGVRGVP